MNVKTITNKILKLFHIPTFMPKSATVNLIAEVAASKLRVSQIMPLKNKVAICVYNNDTRHNSYVYVVDKNGGTSCMHVSNTKETIGMSNKPVKFNGRKIYVLPAEDGSKDNVLYVDWETGAVGKLPFKAPYQYAEVADGSVVYFSGKGKGGFWDVITGKQIDKSISPVPGIVFGMVKDGDNYVCACDDGGLSSTDGWHVGDFVTEVNYAGKRLIAFLREGKVRLVKSKKLGKEIGHTKLKARRSTQDEGNALCYWTTHGPQQLWVTNGSDCKKLADFGGDVVAEAWKEGSCFSSAVAFMDSKTLYVATTRAKNSGWRLYKVDLKW